MARAQRPLVRFDHRGGINRAASPELLDETELATLANGRVQDGALVKRQGSRRVHDTALAGAVVGEYQWDSPDGPQLVVCAGGHVYHKLLAAAEFTDLGATTVESGARVRFATHRIGSSIVLYLADGTNIKKWDGTTLTTVSGSPAATDIAVYKGRMFAADGTKRLYWSTIQDPSDWDYGGGGAPGAGYADVETFDTEGILRIGVVGSSLVIAKANNIARFSGVDAEDIRIDTQTEGISPDVGLIAPATFVPVESVWFGLSDRGPWILTESSLEFVGEKVLPALDAAETSLLPLAVAVHHRARREVWLAIPPAGAAGNTATYAWAYRARSWSGPWTGARMESAARYELADGSESVVTGDEAGIVRAEDVEGSWKDDETAAGSGGSAIAFAAEYPPMHFGDPGAVKRLVGDQRVQAALAVGQTLTLRWTTETGDTGTATITGRGGAMRDYPVRIPRAKGRRITIRLEEESDKPLSIGGLLLTATMEK